MSKPVHDIHQPPLDSLNPPASPATDFTALLDHVPGYVALLDLDLTFNAIYGMQRSRIQALAIRHGSQRLPDLFMGDVRSDVERALRQAIATGTVVSFEASMDCEADSLIWFEHQVTPQGASGAVTRLIVTATDITARKQAEARLLDIERRYQAIFEQSNDAILVSTYRGDDINQIEPLALNPMAIKLLGYSLEEVRLLEIPSTAIIVPEDEDEARRNLEHVVSGKTLPIYERTAISKTGQHIPIEVNMVTVRADDGRPQYGIAIARDISERKRHEEALRQSERFARSTVDALSAHIAILDENGTIVAVNKAWRDFAKKNGTATHVCEGDNYLLTCDAAARKGDADAREFVAGVRAVIEGEAKAFAMEYACHGPSERRWFVGRVTRFPGEGPTRVVVAHENITERKRQEQALARATKQARVASEAKSLFLAHMSHELRTPLNAILGQAQLLAMEDGLAAQAHQRIKVIESSGHHLLHIINDVLDMARIEAGRSTVNVVPVDLHGLLENLWQVFTPRASEKQLQLLLDIASTVPSHILTDEGKLRQILTNLLGNALKFTDAGTVTLRCDFSAGVERQGHLLIEVQDSGRGIAPDQIDHLFQPFEQLRPADVGSGLGLAISLNFARLLGGDIHVRSTPGSGSTFSLDLPVTLAEDRQVIFDPLEVIGVASDQPEQRILIVEDEAESRAVLSDILHRVGMTPEIATDGQTALDSYRRWRPHVLLLDMQLSKLDGYEVTRRIRQDFGDDQTVIIAVTASAFVQQKAAILASGCNDLLAKPYTHAELFAMLAKHTGLQFLYRQSTPMPVDDQSAPTIDAALLARLSQAQLRELYQAALAGYNPAVRQLAARLQVEHPELAAQINAMVERFWVTAIADQIASLLN